MPRRPRIRRVVKWAGLVVCVLIVVAWEGGGHVGAVTPAGIKTEPRSPVESKGLMR